MQVKLWILKLNCQTFVYGIRLSTWKGKLPEIKTCYLKPKLTNTIKNTKMF